MRCVKYLSLVALLSAALFNPANANPIFGYIIAAAGAYMDKVSAKEHDQLIIDYADSILSAIYEVNSSIEGLKKQTCNIYKHALYQDFNAFDVHVLDYASRTYPELFIEDLQNLQWYITDIRKNFEDHQNLVSCSINQHDTYQLYLAISSLDLNLQYEYISKVYKIAYLAGPDGKLADISTLDPATRNTMEQLIENDSQAAFKTRLNDILNHLSILDGSTGVYTWKTNTNKRFSPIKASYYNFYGCGRPCEAHLYDFDGHGYVAYKQRNVWIGKEQAAAYYDCQFWMYPWTCKNTQSDPYFNFLYPWKADPAEQAYYVQHPKEIYDRHKYEVYIAYAKEVYQPGIPIVQSWVGLIKDGSIGYPNLNVENDLATYIGY